MGLCLHAAAHSGSSRARAGRTACGCPKSCRGWSGGMFVFVDEALTAGRSDKLRGQRPAGSLRSGQGRRDRTQQSPVLVGKGWSVVLSVQDCELVAKHDDLSRSFERAGDTSNRHRTRHIGPRARERRTCSARHDRYLRHPQTSRTQRIMPGQRTRPHFRAPTRRVQPEAETNQRSQPGQQQQRQPGQQRRRPPRA